MKKNVGNLDKVLRIILALLIGYLYYSGVISGALGIVLIVFGGILVLTSLVSFCPIYAPFGIKTCKIKP